MHVLNKNKKKHTHTHPHNDAWRSGASDDKLRRVMAKCRSLTAHLSLRPSPARLLTRRPSLRASAASYGFQIHSLLCHFGEDSCVIPYSPSFRLLLLCKGYKKSKKLFSSANFSLILSWQEAKKNSDILNTSNRGVSVREALTVKISADTDV